MENKSLIKRATLKSTFWIVLSCFFASPFGGASMGFLPSPMESGRMYRLDSRATTVLKDLSRLGLAENASQEDLEKLLSYQKRTGKSLAQILADPAWTSVFGMAPVEFKATWYAANPFDHLPAALRKEIRNAKTPLRTTQQLHRWCRDNKFPKEWVKAIDVALVETTAENLWRASQGKKPYAKNGQVLQPIVVEKSVGDFEIHDGHIATDPRVIPTNTKLIIMVRINGVNRILRVKAADIGGAIQGRHVDLPIHFLPRNTKAGSHLQFPKEYIRNPSIFILRPAKKTS